MLHLERLIRFSKGEYPSMILIEDSIHQTYYPLLRQMIENAINAYMSICRRILKLIFRELRVVLIVTESLHNYWPQEAAIIDMRPASMNVGSLDRIMKAKLDEGMFELDDQVVDTQLL